VIALLGLVIVIINSSLSGENQFSPAPTLAWPLLTFLAVVLATGYLTDSIGLQVLGSGSLGGKKYFYIVAAVAGFFALGSRPIPRERAVFWVGVFFLSGLCSAASTAALFMGPAENLIYFLFPPDSYSTAEAADSLASMAQGMVRFSGLGAAALGVFFALMARYGVEGVFNWTRPWRMVGLLFAAFLAAMGGFRSNALLMMATFLGMTFVERTWRTRTFLMIIALGVLGLAMVFGFSEKLPLQVQRSLSFLPISIDPHVAQGAESSSEWRMEMWREAWHREVPEYLFKGKGYAINPDDLHISTFAQQVGNWRNWEWALTAGDYHNGPLSLLIPFGVWGVIAFLWIVFAGFRYLLTNYRNSPPDLKGVNGFLLVLFVVRVLFFLAVYGAIAYDLMHFAGILGLSVALNAHRRATVTEPAVSGLQPAPQE
jgi:hypothetical protein